MIKSVSVELNQIDIPFINHKEAMTPFDLSTLRNVPQEFIGIVKGMLSSFPKLTGEAYLTVFGKSVKKGMTLRKGHPHLDGNRIPTLIVLMYIGKKFDEDGSELSIKHHALAYDNPNGGLIWASNKSSCRGWNGTYEGKAKVQGSCKHIELDEGFEMKDNTVYYGNSQFIHESVPVPEDMDRVMYRITLPVEMELMEEMF